MRHGYTNATTTDGRSVVKRYRGADIARRQHNEVTALTGVAGQLPVPPILAVADGEVTLGLLLGRPGQELLEEQPERVLSATGRLARRLASIDLARLTGLDTTITGTVLVTDPRQRRDPQPLRRAALVHGDFGPQNLLLDEATAEPTALLDWEFAHIGDPIEDIAWAEWILRTHHPHLAPALPALFAGYGTQPTWRVRQESMLAKCRSLLDFVRRWPDASQSAVTTWQNRLATTAAFEP